MSDKDPAHAVRHALQAIVEFQQIFEYQWPRAEGK
jgi:hypothetical protein